MFTTQVHLHRVRAQLVGGKSLLPNLDVPFWAMLRSSYEAGLWQEAEWVLLTVEPPEMHVLAFLERAAAHYRAGDENKARHFVNLAATEFQRVQMDIALIHPIRSLREVGAPTLANQFLKQARDHAQQVRVPWLRSAHLRRIAVAYAVNGEYEEAIRTALMLPNLDEQRNALVGIVGVMNGEL
ncbi:MAG: hypothetical protein NZM28_03540 [Fimbriimonadales bacterium]|nr:hypothetical protein [Fimbriimonadales bacterium]